MPKSVPRTYSRYIEEALILMAGLIRAARLECKLTMVAWQNSAGWCGKARKRWQEATAQLWSKLPQSYEGHGMRNFSLRFGSAI